MSVRELNNIMVIPPEEGDLKKSRKEQNNIIISDSVLENVLPPELKKISECQKFMCGCECCISDKNMRYLLLTWCDLYLEKLEDKNTIIKTEGLVKL